MTDDRPRPQYGEYASREEQLARITVPAPEQLEPSEAKPADTTVVKSTAKSGAKAARPTTSPLAPMLADPEVLAKNRQRFNLVGTILLLVYGFIEVILTTPLFLNLTVLINEQLASASKILGTQLATFPASARTETAGVALIVFWVVVWLLAALWSWARLRRGKFSMWVPLVAGVTAQFSAWLVLFVLLLNDPTISAQLMSSIGR